MTERFATSMDQLDAMLREGRITSHEYEMLRSTLRPGPPPRRESEPPPAAPARRFVKSYAHRQMGGVCYGLAQAFGLSVSGVRMAFVIWGIFSGGAALVVYLILYCLMPWADEPPALKERQPFPTGLVASCLLFLAVYNLWFFRFFHVVQNIYEELNANYPWILQVVTPPLMFFFGTPAGQILQVAAAGALIAGYYLFPRTPQGRFRYTVGVSVVLGVVLILLTLCAYIGLWNIPKVVGRE